MLPNIFEVLSNKLASPPAVKHDNARRGELERVTVDDAKAGWKQFRANEAIYSQKSKKRIVKGMDSWRLYHARSTAYQEAFVTPEDLVVEADMDRTCKHLLRRACPEEPKGFRACECRSTALTPVQQ